MYLFVLLVEVTASLNFFRLVIWFEVLVIDYFHMSVLDNPVFPPSSLVSLCRSCVGCLLRLSLS